MKLTFLSEPGTTRSIALPEHTYYFSKGSNKEGEGGEKKKTVGCTRMSASSGIQTKNTKN